MELARPAMAAAPARERGERERERAGSGEGDGECMLVPLLIGSKAQGVHDAWSSGGEHGIRVSPVGPAIEHLARAMEPNLESIFGIFCAHSDLGASIKVALLWMLYKLD